MSEPTRPLIRRRPPVIPRWFALAAVLILVAVLAVYQPWREPRFQDRPPRPTISLVSGGWNENTIAIQVNEVRSSALNTSLFRFQVVTKDRTVHFSGPSGSTHETNRTNVSLFYHALSPGGNATRGDSVVITVTPRTAASALHGATFKILLGADVLGARTLPG